MARRANQAFTTWVGGAKRQFAQDQVVPDGIADRVLALTYDDGGSAPAPVKSTAKRSTAKSDD